MAQPPSVHDLELLLKASKDVQRQLVIDIHCELHNVDLHVFKTEISGHVVDKDIQMRLDKCHTITHKILREIDKATIIENLLLGLGCNE